MPIYEYECECGARFESLESMGSMRTLCGEDCRRSDAANAADGARVQAERALPARGQGTVHRILSSVGIRGAGHDAKPKVFDPVARANRPGCEDCDPGVAASEADV
ncbi:MAG: hypothetical protein JNJ46_24175 [Myxococcales bacterium]|nr:hypothetical protein [Myxococcales bacterium]